MHQEVLRQDAFCSFQEGREVDWLIPGDVCVWKKLCYSLSTKFTCMVNAILSSLYIKKEGLICHELLSGIPEGLCQAAVRKAENQKTRETLDSFLPKKISSPSSLFPKVQVYTESPCASIHSVPLLIPLWFVLLVMERSSMSYLAFENRKILVFMDFHGKLLWFRCVLCEENISF